MRIRLQKQNHRHRMICVRADGTYTASEYGAGLPLHDLAHYVAERRMGLKKGFFGLVEEGYSLQQLSDAEVIRTLGSEALVAEVFTRALQGLLNGAVRPEEYIPLCHAELAEQGTGLPDIPEGAPESMLAEYRALAEAWQAVPEGGELTLAFP